MGPPMINTTVGFQSASNGEDSIVSLGEDS